MIKKLFIAFALLIILGGVSFFLPTVNTPPPSPSTTPTSESTITPSTVTLADGEVYTLTATPVEQTIAGRTVSLLAYNGSVPGPLIKVTQGTSVTIRFQNDLPYGDTVHFHGIRMQNAFDGVADITQDIVEPGAYFDYQLTFPDAGMFMYHPHMRTNIGLESGLYGNLLVMPKDTTAYAPVNHELPLILDDLLLTGSTIPADDTDGSARYALMGRYGNLPFVNGQSREQLSMTTGSVVRLYLTNLANTRTFSLTLPGAKLKLIGQDVAPLAREEWITTPLVLAPGERAIVDAYFATAGDFALTHEAAGRVWPLAEFTVSHETTDQNYAAAFNTVQENVAMQTELAPFLTYADTPPDKTISFELASGSMPMMDHEMGGMNHGGTTSAIPAPIEWEDEMNMMNAATTAATTIWQLTDTATGKVNLAIDDWQFQKGELIKIRLTNPADGEHPMQHPFHAHGNRFVVLAVDGVPVETQGFKDTVLVPTGSTVDIVLEAANVGTWIAHCHILEHAESGMIMTYTVQ
jgi:FtsP/CotA-like multicopper oxidase with cupredoxin domain